MRFVLTFTELTCITCIFCFFIENINFWKHASMLLLRVNENKEKGYTFHPACQETQKL